MGYETRSFLFEEVKLSDAPDLLRCYSDEKAHERMNWEYCTSDFFYHTLAEMEDCIRFWLRQMAINDFMRYSIIDRVSGRAVGTIEMFDAPLSVFRIDIMSEFETEETIDEILTLAEETMIYDFSLNQLAVKAVNDERRHVLLAHGFERAKDFRPEIEYYIKTVKESS